MPQLPDEIGATCTILTAVAVFLIVHGFGVGFEISVGVFILAFMFFCTVY